MVPEAAGAEGCVVGEEAEDGVVDVEEVAVCAALAPQREIRKSPVERTFIRPGAAGKLEPPLRRRARDRGAEEAEGEAGDREAAAAVEAE